MTLHKSGHQLQEQAIKFIENEKSISLLSAYIKLDQLKRLNHKQNIKQIVVRWEIQDLCVGASDIELYEYCNENNITLYRNTRIHLKAIWNNYNSVLFGSANVTGNGIGEVGNYNFELNVVTKNISLEDKLYFRNIINKSELVDSVLYEKLKNLKEICEKQIVKSPEIETKPKHNDKFLLSQLPMSSSPTSMLNNFFDGQNLSEIDEQCLIQDLSTYEINISLNKEEMSNQLEANFNKHPFIIALKEYIKTSKRQSSNYGSIVRWIQNNTTTVPTPRSWELKKEKIVNILYEWICYFDNNYLWERPYHTQVIYFNKNKKDGKAS
mgnify:CR=1 FL=1